MKKVYAFDIAKKAELMQLLESDPYSIDSFARIGYTVREGATLGADKGKIYLYLSADESFVKKAEDRLKHLLSPLKPEEEKHILEKLLKEEEEAEGGFGSIFGTLFYSLHAYSINGRA